MPPSSRSYPGSIPGSSATPSPAEAHLFGHDQPAVHRALQTEMLNEQRKLLNSSKELGTGLARLPKEANFAAEAMRALGVGLLGHVPIIGRVFNALAAQRIITGQIGGGGGRGMSGAAMSGSVAGGIAAVAISTVISTANEALSRLRDTVISLAAAATPGGLKLVDDAFEELMMTLGVHLAPLIPLAAAGIQTIADLLGEVLSPVLGDSSDVIQTLVLPAVEGLIYGLLKLAQIITGVVGGILKAIQWLTDNKLGRLMVESGTGGLVKGEDLSAGADQLGKLGESLMNMADRFGDKANTVDVGNKFNAALKDQMQNLKMEFAKNAGATPQFSAIADVWKNMQLRTFVSPHEARKLEFLRKSMEHSERALGLQERIAENTAHQPFRR